MKIIVNNLLGNDSFQDCIYSKKEAMKQWKLLAAICLSTILSTACSKQQSTAANADLEGNWQWLSTDGGLANHIHETPTSTGKQIVLSIAANRTYILYTNGLITEQGSFSIGNQTCIHHAKTKRYIDFSGTTTDGMIESIENGILLLSDEAHDGLTQSFSKQ